MAIEFVSRWPSRSVSVAHEFIPHDQHLIPMNDWIGDAVESFKATSMEKERITVLGKNKALFEKLRHENKANKIQ